VDIGWRFMAIVDAANSIACFAACAKVMPAPPLCEKRVRSLHVLLWLAAEFFGRDLLKLLLGGIAVAYAARVMACVV